MVSSTTDVREQVQPFLLSVVIPVYNEKPTLQTLIESVLEAPYDKQIILVDDGSTDGSRQIVQAHEGRDGFDVVLQPENRGKGAALRAGFRLVKGDAVIIQDADLEYDPGDYPLLIEIIRKGNADVVYGSRYQSNQAMLPWTKYRLGVMILNLLVKLLYFRHITNEATCYKAFRASVLKAIPLRCRRFEFCSEVTAKCIRRGYPIIEVPISFRFRTVEAGKKIRMRDGFEAAWALLKFRFVN